MIYLDYSANTPASEEALRRFCEVEHACMGNANSRHAAGRAAKAEIGAASQTISQVLGARGADVIYTSGATEANNLAIKGLAALGGAGKRHIISTPLEHSSVSGSLAALQKQGYEVSLIKLTPDGIADLDSLRALLRHDTALVAVAAVDSELGTVQPVEEIAGIVHSECPGCRLHVDATQAIGKISVAFGSADTMSFTAHKFYGLNGIGVLLKRRSIAIEPLLHGGASTTIYRAGTPTVALASSLALALENAAAAQPERSRYVAALNGKLRRTLSQYLLVEINSPEAAVPHILNLSVRGVKGTVFQRELDARGVCVSVRSACSSDGLPSAAVTALYGDERRALSSWRISLSHLTTEDELGEFLRIFGECYEELTKAR